MKRLLLLALWPLATAAATAQSVEPFPLHSVRLLPSRFQQNMQRDSAWLAAIPAKRLLHSFRNTAGLFSDREGGYDTGVSLGGWESPDCDLRGHITGHILSALAYLSPHTSHPSPLTPSLSPLTSHPSPLRQKADSIVDGLAEVQQHYGTGYLSAFGEGLIDRNIQGKSVWAPFYTLHKILQGLIDQYRLCGNEKALAVARGMGDWAYKKLSGLSEETRQRMLRNEFGGFNEAMYNLYAITGDEKHLWVARFFYHNDKIDPLKAGNNDLGTYHANTFIPKLLGECSNYELFGNDDSRRAAELLFRTLVDDHAFVTGEVSDKEHLFKPATQSRHLSGYDGENCCTFNLLKLADRLFCYQPQASIADYYERALYNHILGQQDTISSMVCYFTPLMTGAYRLYSTPDKSFWCCVGSGFESHAKYQSSIYFHNDKELYVNLFIPSEVNWKGTVVRQETRFPEANTTTLTIEHADAPLTLKLRYPCWATYMKVNGRKVKAGTDGYVSYRLSARQAASAKITVEFGMALREVPTKDDATRVALMYGPVVLAGRLADVEHPFSDPTKHNDYYTFDYGSHDDVPLGTVSRINGLRFKNSSGAAIEPFYNMHHCRYVVYWKK